MACWRARRTIGARARAARHTPRRHGATHGRRLLMHQERTAALEREVAAATWPAASNAAPQHHPPSFWRNRRQFGATTQCARSTHTRDGCMLRLQAGRRGCPKPRTPGTSARCTSRPPPTGGRADAPSPTGGRREAANWGPGVFATRPPQALPPGGCAVHKAQKRTRKAKGPLTRMPQHFAYALPRSAFVIASIRLAPHVFRATGARAAHLLRPSGRNVCLTRSTGESENRLRMVALTHAAKEAFICPVRFNTLLCCKQSWPPRRHASHTLLDQHARPAACGRGWQIRTLGAHLALQNSPPKGIREHVGPFEATY